MQPAPVCAATRPLASTKATWRPALAASCSSSVFSARPASIPWRISDSPRGPYAGSANACVATAPTPASAHVTTVPTENQCDCTATPRSPETGSRATMEYVIRSAQGRRRPRQHALRLLHGQLVNALVARDPAVAAHMLEAHTRIHQRVNLRIQVEVLVALPAPRQPVDHALAVGANHDAPGCIVADARPDPAQRLAHRLQLLAV